MDECRVQPPARLPALPAIVTGHGQSTVIEEAEILRLRLHLVVAPDGPPQVALYRLRSVVATTHAQRKAVGGVTDELGMQQRRQRRTVPGVECRVELLGGRDTGVKGVHLVVPLLRC